MRIYVIAAISALMGAGLAANYANKAGYAKGYAQAQADAHDDHADCDCGEHCGYHAEPGLINEDGEELETMEAYNYLKDGQKVFRVQQMEMVVNIKTGTVHMRKVAQNAVPQ